MVNNVHSYLAKIVNFILSVTAVPYYI